MTANRIIPYGYAVESGRNIIHPEESGIVRRIFADYLGGASFLKVAQALTAEKVEFIPGRSDWNKHRIKRIIEDERYLGTDTYPAVISEDIHRQAQAVKVSNNTQNRAAAERPTLQKSELPCRLTCPVECALCGAKMVRRHDSRRKDAQDVWTCQNPDCHSIIKISDDHLHGRITELLNRLIADPGIIQADTAPPEPGMDVRRLQNEVNRELDSFEFDRDKAKAAIFALAVEKYRHIDPDPHAGQILRAAFEDSKLLQSEPLSSFSPELFKKTVQKIQLGEGVLRLILKNNQNIEGSNNHADSDSNSNSDGTGAAY